MTPTPSTRRVLLFGDSLTAGNYLSEGQRPGHWVSLLSGLWKDQIEFLNEGKGGRSSDCLEEFAAVLGAYSAPDLLVLWLGTNDSREMDGEVARRTAQNLRQMIHRARARYGPELAILLVAPPNIHPPAYTKYTPEFAEARQANLRAIGGAIDQLATGEHCAKVDLFDTLPAASLTGDGVHPDTEGNLAMARVLAPALAHILGTSSSPWHNPPGPLPRDL